MTFIYVFHFTKTLKSGIIYSDKECRKEFIMKKIVLTDYYFFEGKYSKVPQNEVRKLKKGATFSLKKRTITLKFSSNLKKRTKKEMADFIEESLCSRRKSIKETIQDASMLYDVRIAYTIKCGKKVILFIRTP